MSAILEKYNRAVSKFTTKSEFDEWLKVIGRSLKVKDTISIRCQENYIRGCKSNAWITIDQSGKLLFDSTSDYTKGIGKILVDVFNENASTIKIIDFRNITQGLTREEIQGMSKMISRINTLLTNSKDSV